MKDYGDFFHSQLINYGCYFEQNSFCEKLTKLAVRAGMEIVHKALLLYYILLDDDTPLNVKGLIIGALGYLVLPIDLIPDVIVGLGFADDLAALTFVLSQVETYKTPEIEEKATRKFKDIFD